MTWQEEWFSDGYALAATFDISGVLWSLHRAEYCEGYLVRAIRDDEGNLVATLCFKVPPYSENNKRGV